MPPNPPSKRVASPCITYPHFSRKILNPSRNEILDTPLHDYSRAFSSNLVLWTSTDWRYIRIKGLLVETVLNSIGVLRGAKGACPPPPP